MEEGDYSGSEATAATPEQESVTISADLLGGVPVKSGDEIRFCATSDPDEDGNVTGYFKAAEVEAAPEEEETWEEGALKVGKNNSMEGKI